MPISKTNEAPILLDFFTLMSLICIQIINLLCFSTMSQTVLIRLPIKDVSHTGKTPHMSFDKLQ
jgi:hypothetical protein